MGVVWAESESRPCVADGELEARRWTAVDLVVVEEAGPRPIIMEPKVESVASSLFGGRRFGGGGEQGTLRRSATAGGRVNSGDAYHNGCASAASDGCQEASEDCSITTGWW